jgi:HPt (histidine-containing phosphotransfer) domain-containing protein
MEVVIDASILEEMPPALAGKLVGMWEKNATKCIADLKEAITNNDPKGIKMHLHTLKGISAQVGAVTVSDLAKMMEKQEPLVSDVKKVMMLEIVFADTLAQFNKST